MNRQHLIIDGYNIIYADPELKKLLTKGLEHSRNELIRIAKIIHENDNIHVSVIFDGKGDKTHIEILAKDPVFQVMFSASEWSADSLIEQLSASVKNSKNIVAATEDRMIQATLRSLNAQTINSYTLRDWIQNLKTYSQEQNFRGQKKLKQEWAQELRKKWNNL